MPEPLQQAITFLSRDILRNIVLLKMLHAYPEAIRCYYGESQVAAGVLLLLPTQVSAFDVRAYPASQFVVFLSTTSAAATQALLPHIPAGCQLVFKLMDEHDQAEVKRSFPLHQVTSYLSYTCPAGSVFAPSPEVVVSDAADAASLELYVDQGHSREVMQAYFTSGQAIALALYQHRSLISVCFAYRIFGEVWEIGGVYTAPDHRRQGHARQVVATALHVLLTSKRIPRYQVHENNLASIYLAETLGLYHFVTMEHFLIRDT